jgi:hypothetical protein
MGCQIYAKLNQHSTISSLFWVYRKRQQVTQLKDDESTQQNVAEHFLSFHFTQGNKDDVRCEFSYRSNEKIKIFYLIREASFSS